jgi:site-specific DNA recombinase
MPPFRFPPSPTFSDSSTEADAKLKRLYDAIENGVTDLSDLMLKDRITELKAIRDQARADTLSGLRVR